MRFLFLFPLILILSCGRQHTSTHPVADSYESCLAQEKLFVAGACVDGAGLKGADLRTVLFVEAPFLDTLHKNEVEICILTESRFDDMRPELEAQIRSSILAWVEPLRQVSEIMPRKVRFVHPLFSESMLDPDQPLAQLCPSTSDGSFVYVGDMTRFNRDPEDRAFAKYQLKEVWMSPYNMRRGTILHEYGHLFGLGDIYIEDQWNCRKDFPNSVMCQVEWDTPLPADRLAVQRSYCLETDGVHPNCFNHEPKELLAFLPKKRTSPTYGFNFRDPYIVCENDSEGFSFQAFSFAVGNHFLGLFASDQTAVKEQMKAGGFLDEFTVELINDQPRWAQPIQLQMELRDEKLNVRFPLDGQIQEQSFASCYVDPRLLTYLAKHDVQIPKSLLRQQLYHLLRSQPAPVENYGESSNEGGKYAFLPQPPPAGAEIQIFDAGSRELLKSLPFYETAKIIQEYRQGFFWQFTPESLNLAAGDYELFITFDENVYEHLIIKVNP